MLLAMWIIKNWTILADLFKFTITLGFKYGCDVEITYVNYGVISKVVGKNRLPDNLDISIIQ